MLGCVRTQCWRSLEPFGTLAHAASVSFRGLTKLTFNILLYVLTTRICSARRLGCFRLPFRQFDLIAGDVYPELYQTFVSKLNPINLDLEFVFSYSCLVTNTFYSRLVFATITPLLALVVLAGSCTVGTKRNSRSESATRKVRRKHQAAVVNLALLVLSPVSYMILRAFGGDELDDKEAYLRADYSISRLTYHHSWYKFML